MLALKFIALVLGAATLFSVYAADFTPDFVLAIAACLS
jgi:predicted membrane-bound dolichyl-phosphate-mannose-protein mannosyltransferase